MKREIVECDVCHEHWSLGDTSSLGPVAIQYASAVHPSPADARTTVGLADVCYACRCRLENAIERWRERGGK